MFKIDTLTGHERMSTQELLLAIGEAVANGETEFEIAASGQHDIGGPLWHPEGKKLTFHVTNAGQRVGSMCLDNTEIVVDESASADVGWLNAGGKITVRGDAGDTAGHCSAGGKIYIGGRAGTRSGSLMKHDPLYEEPELWILKNVGSFSFEFMGGGRAVVCGIDSENFSSVLGDRACVGMVGGIVYFRGNASGYASDIKLFDLDAADIAFLDGGIDEFLDSIGRPEFRTQLSDWSQWHKLRPLTFDEKKEKAQPNLTEFRTQEWVKGGIFNDVAMDDFAVYPTVVTGLYRQRVPSWDNAKYAAPCEFNCPAGIPSQRRFDLIREGKLEEAYKLVLDYTPFPGSVCGSVCPNLCMQDCTRSNLDEAVQIGGLGLQSVHTEIEVTAEATGKTIGVIGGGMAGLSAAWQLARKGHDVTVYDDAKAIGGKLEQVIPRGRLPHEILEAELKRIESAGVKFVADCKVDLAKFADIRQSHDAVIVATGGHKARFFPWEGTEKLTMGIDFLKAVNRGEKPAVGKKVVVIGCGNSGMDTAVGAYQMGAETVTCIDVQKPAAFAHEIEHVEELGGRLIWPFMTAKITDEGIYDKDGQFIPGDMVIVSIGEAPVLDYLPEDSGIKKFREWLVPNDEMEILDGVFAAGDVIKPGRLVDAIGGGLQAAHFADSYVLGKPAEAFVKKEQIPADRISKAYFDKCHHCDLESPVKDDARCISCGTCRDCKMCLNSCPEKAITRNELDGGGFEYVSDPERCIGCGICAGICPCGVWSISENKELINMYRTNKA